MIVLNITLVFQVINFLIAYALLRKFLWKPVILYIDEQDKKQAQLEKDLDKERQIVEQKIFSLDQMWQRARSSFLVHVPSIVRAGAVRKEEEYDVIEPKVSPEMVRALSEEIVKKVQE